MARSITTRSTNPKIMDDNIKILDDALASASTPPAEDVSYDNTDSGLTATNTQEAIDETINKFNGLYVIESKQETFSSYTVSANAYNDYNINVSKEGYTALGVLGCIISGGPRVVISYYGLSAANNVKIRFNNFTDTVITMYSITITILYKKN